MDVDWPDDGAGTYESSDTTKAAEREREVVVRGMIGKKLVA